MKRYAWWNQYGSVPIAQCVERAKAAHLDAVIVKNGYPDARNAFATAGVPFATERYVYPADALTNARQLNDDVQHGAAFVVLNAEVEWETTAPTNMPALITELRRLTAAPVYGCTDTRGTRMQLPYQRTIAAQCDGWMPMIYKAAFGQPTTLAFAAALDGKDFAGKPVIPAIQEYGNVGPGCVAQEIAECRRRRLDGYGAYTIAHATDAEWAVVTADAGPTPAEHLARLNKTAEIFVDCAGHALRDQALPDALAGAAKYLLQ